MTEKGDETESGRRATITDQKEFLWDDDEERPTCYLITKKENWEGNRSTKARTFTLGGGINQREGVFLDRENRYRLTGP